jgi:GNAT superfamily N-acetyltransferase
MPIIDRLSPRKLHRGRIVFSFYEDRAALDPNLPFGQETYPLEYYLMQAGLSESYPFAIVHDLNVHHRHQRKGHGTWLLEEFDKAAFAAGCRISLLKVGWTNLKRMEPNKAFYRNRGWTLVQPEECYSFIALKAVL